MLSDLNSEQRVQLTNQMMQLLDSWGTSGDQKIVLLGLPDDMRARKLERFRKDEAFPDTDALRTSYPRNIEMCARWMRQPHKRFENKTPLSVMVTKGLAGLIQVRAQLDCSFAWNSSGSN